LEHSGLQLKNTQASEKLVTPADGGFGASAALAVDASDRRQWEWIAAVENRDGASPLSQ
jgi:hypothetical protein